RFVAAPQDTARGLAQWAGWGWDRELGPSLPLSRYTMTAPDPDKWRKHAAEIEPRLAPLADTLRRAAAAPGPRSPPEVAPARRGWKASRPRPHRAGSPP